jgi:hypothetical protein
VSSLKVPVTQASEWIGGQTAEGRELAKSASDISFEEEARDWIGIYRRWCQVTAAMLEATYDGKDEVNRFHGAISVRHIVAVQMSSGQVAMEEAERLERALGVLQGFQDSLRFAAGPEAPASAKVLGPRMPGSGGTDGTIFVVHGHSETLTHLVARVIEKGTGVDATILGEQEIAGLTLLEKFEQFAAGASFAVVLLTADDVGGVRPPSDDDGTEVRPRARQNVVFEMGWFFGALGRDRVAAIYDEGVELPSDLGGLAYIANDAAGAWKQKLGKQLETAGFAVNFSRMP